MKKQLLITLTLLISTAIYSQYKKTLYDNSTWYEYYYFESAWNEQYKVSGDTIFNDTIYKIISQTIENISEYKYNYYFREDSISRKIYQYYNGDNKEILSYDYGLNIGDTFWMPTQYWGYDFLILDSIKYKLTTYLSTIDKHVDMEMPNNRVFYLSDPDYHVKYTWIEGIGSIKGLCNEWGYDDHNVLCHFDSSGIMDLHLNIDSTCTGPVYDNIQTFKKQEAIVYPNPTNGLININTEFINQVEIFNNYGQKIHQSLDSKIDIRHFTSGIYFIKIRKNNEILIERVIKR